MPKIIIANFIIQIIIINLYIQNDNFIKFIFSTCVQIVCNIQFVSKQELETTYIFFYFCYKL